MILKKGYRVLLGICESGLSHANVFFSLHFIVLPFSIRHLHISHNTPSLPPSPPPPILRSLCFQLSWVLQSSQGKLKTLLMQNLWGKTKCIKGDVQVANYVIWFTRTVLMLSASNRLPPLSRWPVYTIYFCRWFVNEFLLSVSCCQVLRWRQQSQGRRPTTCHVSSP